MPIQKVDKIWMDGELVDWDDAKIHVLTHTLHYGSGVFEGIRAYHTADGPAVFRLTDHIRRLLQSATMLMIESPYSRRTARRGDQGDGAGQQHRGLLHPAADLPGLRRDGPQPVALHRQRLDRRLAVGHLPRRGGHQARRPLQDRLLAPPGPEHDPAGGQGHRPVRQLQPGQGRSPQGGLRRGHPPEHSGPRVGVHRREPVHRQGRANHHAPALGGGARRHHPRLHHGDRPGSGVRGGGGEHSPQRPLHRRRGVPHRDGRRGGPDPFGRRPGDRGAG